MYTCIYDISPIFDQSQKKEDRKVLFKAFAYFWGVMHITRLGQKNSKPDFLIELSSNIIKIFY